MKIDRTPYSVNNEELRLALEKNFSDYKVFMRNKNIIVVQKSGTIGTTILVGKKALIINGNFPSMGGSILFALCCVLLGFLIPLIIYFAAFHSKMKAVEKEVAAFINEKWLHQQPVSEVFGK